MWMVAFGLLVNVSSQNCRREDTDKDSLREQTPVLPTGITTTGVITGADIIAIHIMWTICTPICLVADTGEQFLRSFSLELLDSSSAFS